ncbi:MAG TPA: FtsX-like permease family protein [Longimicrobiales bacterium]|nr:FtsX-like permease family protein [Longimicrobiales bacterium]
MVRTEGDPSAVLPVAAAKLNTMDPQLVLHRPMALSDVLGRGLAQRRFTVWLMTGYAALALVLASLGLFGVITYVVRQRRREIGIRSALGARPAQIRSMILAQGVRVTAFGIAGGMFGAAVLGRVLETLLFETRPADPLVLLGTAVVRTTIALAAAWLPAGEASSIDPGTVLQEE